MRVRARVRTRACGRGLVSLIIPVKTYFNPGTSLFKNHARACARVCTRVSMGFGFFDNTGQDPNRNTSTQGQIYFKIKGPKAPFKKYGAKPQQ